MNNTIVADRFHPISARVDVDAPRSVETADILTPEAIAFIERLEREFRVRRKNLLNKRIERQIEINSGKMPDFLNATEHIRTSQWKVAECPMDLIDRRVELTGTVDLTTIIDSMNSGANVFIADFEDSLSPTWKNIMEGQRNLRGVVDGSLSLDEPVSRSFVQNRFVPALMVRPRGWHMEERHFKVDGVPVSASLFDFGLFFFHNAHQLIKDGTAPYFYLPKLENHFEAALWEDVFILAQDELGIPHGAIRATVLIETITAAFEMSEILYELRQHSAGLSCGKWDYIASFVKKFRHRPEYLLPDREHIQTNAPFLRACSTLAVQTCHRHGAHAIGGLSAGIPITNGTITGEREVARFRAEKQREADDGHDGTRVADPGLVQLAREIFNAKMKDPNHILGHIGNSRITATELLTPPSGEISEEGVRSNVEVSLTYIESWLRGIGRLSINGLMEDAATVEIARTQLWHWINNSNAMFESHHRITPELIEVALSDVLQSVKESKTQDQFAEGKFLQASELLRRLVFGRGFEEFFTVAAYDLLD
jgi:malate synthase